MKNLLLIITLILSISSKGQTFNPTYLDFNDKISNYDISPLFVKSVVPERHGEIALSDFTPLGFFGSNYQRFDIHFISVIQNVDNPKEYFVYGKSRLKGTICPFQGTFKIIDSKILEEGDIPEFKQGFVTFEYILYEDKQYGGTGFFKGNCKSNFFIDDKDELYYDAISLGADGFKNNQFEGIWISYKSDKSYICNWGDFRIPNSGDLDIGAGEFSINDEYIEFGWKTYKTAYGYDNTISEEEKLKAKEIERLKWWE